MAALSFRPSKLNFRLDRHLVRRTFYDGIGMGEAYEPASVHLDKIRSMALRPDDVMVCSFPKSGSHWIYRLTDMLVRGAPAYDQRCFGDIHLDLQKIELLEKLDSPRIITSHLPFSKFPFQLPKRCTKIVHIYRNPKSVLVSLYFYLARAGVGTNAGGNVPQEETLAEMFNELFLPNAPYGEWFKYMDEVQNFLKMNHGHPIFSISYEEILQSPLSSVKQLAEFLSLEASDQLCEDIVEACSFRRQKEEEEKREAAFNIFRQGEADDWKNYLTVAMSEKIDKILRIRAAHCPFAARYVS